MLLITGLWIIDKVTILIPLVLLIRDTRQLNYEHIAAAVRHGGKNYVWQTVDTELSDLNEDKNLYA